MSERIVDRFEVVEVDLHQRRLLFMNRRQYASQIIAELTPVGQTSQGIVRRLVKQQRTLVFALARGFPPDRCPVRLDDADAMSGAKDEQCPP